MMLNKDDAKKIFDMLIEKKGKREFTQVKYKDDKPVLLDTTVKTIFSIVNEEGSLFTKKDFDK